MSDTEIHRIVANCRAGDYAPAIARMKAGWAVMGQRQFLMGYCLLLPDPVVPNLNSLSGDCRNEFLSDMAELGDAVQVVTEAIRINYAILGNLEPALHAHVVPRFESELEPFKTGTPWSYDWNLAPEFDLNLHGEIFEQLRVRLRT